MAHVTRVALAGEFASRLGPSWMAETKLLTLALGVFTGEKASISTHSED